MAIYPDINVLVAEDKTEMRHIIKTLVLSFKVRHVYEAPDGREALNTIKSSKGQKDGDGQKSDVHLVIADWMMPIMTGFELLREIRSEPQFCSLPFLMVTGENEEKSVASAIAYGVNDYIIKPFTSRDFVEKCEVLLQQIEMHIKDNVSFNV